MVVGECEPPNLKEITTERKMFICYRKRLIVKYNYFIKIYFGIMFSPTTLS